VLALRIGSVWFGVLAVFILLNCWGGLKQSMALLRLAKLPRHEQYTCPWCKETPPRGNSWTCGNCRTMFDIFDAQGACPYCSTQFPAARCLHCGRLYPMNDWIVSASMDAKA
jgi:hypothetical protein